MEGTISYLLIKIATDSRLSEVIPLHASSENLYAINRWLGLKLAPETAAPYLVFFGLVVTGDEGSFYFVTNVNQAMNLFIYGLSNTFNLPTVSDGMNFMEAFLLIVLSVPVIGPSLGWVFKIGDTVGLYHVYRDSLLMYLSSAVISTITFGWLIRLYRMGQNSD